MITGLDHVVILLNDLEAGIAAYQTLFSRKPAWRSTSEGAELAIFTLANMSVELLAPQGDGTAANRIRAVLPESGASLASICFATNDIAKMHRRLDRVALKPDPIAEVESRDRDTGATLSWKRTRAATDHTRGVRQFFLELNGERPASASTSETPVIGLDHIVVATQDPERAAALYGARLGLDLALDRSNPDWGHLMFFRCGDLIVELVKRPHDQGDIHRDVLWGMTWRVTDIDATRERLLAAHVTVSEVRSGRKPGTRVASLRDGTLGIPTLLIEREERES
ncbi:glyoxalase [Rhodopseudomonas boonkerdii]|uniref:VOC family protein n=1 Tax=Rhodopseudomonas boonkerdii TaxID=475937 RepID=UPI001E2B439F|nr:VOC family protein [Rhodopseudomonas boonkerdii]UGV25922.1 glyoxalase [Rhodopseudomonas boonkerdii]